MLTGGIRDDLSLIQHSKFSIPNDGKFLHLLAAAISLPHRTRAFAYFEGFVRNMSVFRSLVMLYQLVKKTWHILFEFFARNIN